MHTYTYPLTGASGACTGAGRAGVAAAGCPWQSYRGAHGTECVIEKEKERVCVCVVCMVCGVWCVVCVFVACVCGRANVRGIKEGRND